MCDFFSAIILKNGELVYDLNTSSHEDLIEKRGLVDDTTDPEKMEFVRFEILPPDARVFSKPAKWHFKIVQDIIPGWFSEKLKEKCLKLFEEEVYPQCVFINQRRLKFLNRNDLFLKNCSAQLYGSSSAEFFCLSSAELHDSSSARIFDRSTAVLHDNSRAELFDRSSAVLHDFATVALYGSAKAKSSEKNNLKKEV